MSRAATRLVAGAARIDKLYVDVPNSSGTRIVRAKTVTGIPTHLISVI